LSSQHTTFEASHVTLSATYLDSVTRSVPLASQTAIDAVNSVVGYNNINGNNVALAAAAKAAGIAKLEALSVAEKVRQTSIAVAREILKNAATAESAGPF
jgi:hypothetical protein